MKFSYPAAPDATGILTADLAAGGEDRTETNRRFIVLLIATSYWLLIFEGVLRKWVFPEYQKALFFLRDPLTIATYLAAWRYGFTPVRSIFLWIGGLFALAAVPLTLVQYGIEQEKFSWLLALYGWRNYFLLLPLPFIIARCFRLEDVETLIRRTLWLTIPLAVLVYVQFSSSPTAAINQGNGDADNTFSGLALVKGKIRPLGTFTSNQGQSPFVAASLAMVFIAWMTPAIRVRIHSAGLLAATGAALSMLAFSGSRTAALWCALVLVFAVAAPLLASRHRPAVPMLVAPGLIVFLAATLLPIVFPDAVAAFTDRWQVAQKSEVTTHGQGGIFSRALNDLFLFKHLLSEEHLAGYQLGIGGNAAYLMGLRDSMMRLDTMEQGFALESEWGRHVADMGVLGILFILYRIAFAASLLGQAARATSNTGNAHPMLLFGFLGTLLLNGQITGQGAQNGFAFLFIGFTLAACNAAEGEFSVASRASGAVEAVTPRIFV
jgi:hypothetical protein